MSAFVLHSSKQSRVDVSVAVSANRRLPFQQVTREYS